MPIDRLYVIWRAPTERRTRHIVGTLSREASGGFCFEYADAAALEAARADYFREVLSFPVAQRKHHSPYLFTVFSLRIPSPARADYQEMMTEWGVDNPDDVMEVLARSGGITATDRLELAEYRALSDQLTEPLEFRIAGARFRQNDVESIKDGTRLTLKREPENDFDACASMVLRSDDGKHLGYVPRQYAALIARHLDAGNALDVALVRRVPLFDETGWVARVKRRATPS